MTDGPNLNSDEIDYTLGYYPELTPLFLSLCALLAGYRFDCDAAPRYLELGFGQGVSLNINAAASRGAFMGNDFAASHVAFAKKLASASGAPLRLVSDSFQQLAKQDDLPMFDIIVLHGIWTWITEPDREAVFEIVRRALVPGGLLYISHNCAFSWTVTTPVRKLMHAHVKADASSKPLTEKVRNALDFVQTLIEQDARHFKVNPVVAAHLEIWRKSDLSYLVHELFAHGWDPTSIADLSERFSPAGVEFVGYAWLTENMPAYSANEAGQKFCSSIPDRILREITREAFLNSHFRKDIFMKEPVRLTKQEQTDALLRRRFVLTAPPDAVPLQVNGPNGKVSLDPGYFRQLLSALAAHSHAPKTAVQLAQVLGAPPREIVDHLCLLCGPHVHPAHEADPCEELIDRCKRLNKLILSETAAGRYIPSLACAVTGSGLHVTAEEQLVLHNIQAGAVSAEVAADKTLALLHRLGGVSAPSRTNLIEATRRLQANALPIITALGML